MTSTLSLISSKPRAIFIASVLVIVVGIIDLLTGREWHITPLYMLPLGIAAWGAGRRWGIGFSVFIAATWLVAAELAVGPEYSHPAIPFWNAVMFLVVFLAVALLLARLHQIMETLDRRVRARSEQLRIEMARRYQAELAGLRSERLAVVGSMAAQMAHEVRNPMCSISLNMELLSQQVATLTATESEAGTEATLLMAQMEKELGRIDHVIRDYLGFARLPKVMPHSHKLHSFLDEKLRLVVPELAAAHVRLATDYDPAIDRVALDPVQMWQVLLNLIRNAREAMPDGGDLMIRTSTHDHEIQIAVKDNGCGIGGEDRARLFTPFFTTKAHGTGLGLALSQQIVAEHGGRLECESIPRSGSTFTITLPLRVCPERSPHPKTKSIHPQPTASHELQPASTC